MVCVDTASNHVRMKDGQMMDAKDGLKLMMTSNVIGQAVAVRGALKPHQ